MVEYLFGGTVTVRILLIEDNHLFGELIGAYIDGVTAVESLGEALALLNQEHFDLMLVDLGLPDSQGVETLSALSHFKIPKIVITVTERHLKEAAQMGYIDFITKGSTTEMVERIQFNINKLARKRIRLMPAVFEQIKVCLASRLTHPQLTLAR